MPRRTTADVRHRFVQAPDARIHYLDCVPRGSEEYPPMLVLPGGPGESARLFAREMRAVDLDVLGLRRIVVDYRCIGDSTGPLGTFRLARLAEDLELIRKDLGVERIGVLGLSFGGFAALTYATAFPDSVAFLVALDTEACSATGRLSAARYLERHGNASQREVWRRWAEIADHERPWDPAQHCADWGVLAPLYTADRRNRIGMTALGLACRAVGRWPALYPLAARIERRVGYWREVGGEWHVSEYGTYDVRERLGRITAPTLVLCGEEDWRCPVVESEAIAAGIPGAELVVIPGAGHTTPMDAPEVVTSALRDFLERRVRGAPPETSDPTSPATSGPGRHS